MESHELLHEVFKRTSAKKIADDLDLSLSMIYKWSEPPERRQTPGTSNPLERMEELHRSTKDERIVQWVCERAGGFFIRNPKHSWPHPHQLIPAANQIVQEFADLLAVVATAAGDNSISPDEAKRIRRRWEDLKTVTEGFVHCCEQGNFQNLPGTNSESRPSA